MKKRTEVLCSSMPGEASGWWALPKQTKESCQVGMSFSFCCGLWPPSTSASARLTSKQSSWSSKHCFRLGHYTLRFFLTFLLSLRLDSMAVIKVILSRWNFSRKQPLAQGLTHSTPGPIVNHVSPTWENCSPKSKKESRLHYLIWLLLSMFWAVLLREFYQRPRKSSHGTFYYFSLELPQWGHRGTSCPSPFIFLWRLIISD